MYILPKKPHLLALPHHSQKPVVTTAFPLLGAYCNVRLPDPGLRSGTNLTCRLNTSRFTLPYKQPHRTLHSVVPPATESHGDSSQPFALALWVFKPYTVQTAMIAMIRPLLTLGSGQRNIRKLPLLTGIRVNSKLSANP